MAKDENSTIVEWVIHHIKIGFDHIVIYDDMSCIPIFDTLKSSLPDDLLSFVTVFVVNKDYYSKDDFIDSELYDPDLYNISNFNKQNYFLSLYLKRYREVADYTLFIDCDEFLWIRDFLSIKEFMKSTQYCDGVYIPWAMFGTSFYADKPDGSVQKNFIRHAKYLSRNGKTIVKNNKSIDYPKAPHDSFLINGAKRFWKDFDKSFDTPIQLNHYITMDLRGYLKKKLRSEIGYRNGKSRNPIEIFGFSCEYNDVCRSDYLSSPIKNSSSWLYVFGYDVDGKLFPRLLKDISISDLEFIIDSKKIQFLISEIPESFSLEKYRSINKDLQHLTSSQLLNHFLKFAGTERRSWL